MGDWKKVYSAPRLTAYGHVTTLTQAGTGATAEQNPGKGAATKQNVMA